ncbi:MAG: YfhO family protein [Gemmatimonadetes bacterium]|nr:YfhO family protein [Gemmatimonadota bacterium]
MTTPDLAPANTEPPRGALWAALACALAALALGYPALGGQFLVNPMSDQYIAGFAFRDFAVEQWRATGAIPLWNPYLFGGMPFVAAMHGDIFYPTFWLRLLLGTDTGMTWGFISHLWLAGFGTYLFLRAAGLGFASALVGALAYQLGGPIAAYASPGHDGKLFVSALLPFTLLLLTRGIRDNRHWAWGALAIVIGLAVLSPHPQLLQYHLLVAGAWALMLAFGTAGLDRPTAFKRLGFALGAVLLGCAIGTIQYLPLAEYTPWSPRAGGRDYAYATSYSWPIEELINVYLPQFSGILDNYWGRNGIHLHSEYLGAAVLMLVPLAFMTGGEARRGFRRFWVGVGIVSLLWALGGSTPFFQLVYAVVPGTKFFRAPSTMMFVFAFAIAVLAALGAERLFAGKVTARYAYGWIIAGAAVALLATAGMFTGLAKGLVIDPSLIDRVEANAGAVTVGAWRSFLFVALAAGMIIALARGLSTARQVAIALPVLLAADLWSIERRYWMFSPPAAQLFASDATIDYLKQLKEPTRVAVIPVPDGNPVAPHDPQLQGDGLMVHEIRSVTGYHGNELGRYQQLGGKDEGYSARLNPSFWQLMNVGYMLTNTDTLPIDGAVRVAGPVTNAAGTRVALYKLPGEHPFAWVAPAIAKYPDDVVLQAARMPNFATYQVAIMDTAEAVQGVTLTSLPDPSPITVATTSYRPGAFTLKLSAPAPAGSALVASEIYYPGWTATVDGKPAEVYRTNYVLMGVPLPTGATTAEFTFANATYPKGRRITYIAVLLSLLLIAAGFAVDRRTRQNTHG